MFVRLSARSFEQRMHTDAMRRVLVAPESSYTRGAPEMSYRDWIMVSLFPQDKSSGKSSAKTRILFIDGILLKPEL